MKKYLLISILILVSFVGLVILSFIKYFDGNLHLVICNVGQGDAILIRTPKGFDILVDAGPDQSVLECLNNHMPFWDKTIELAILTHPHADHLNGFYDVLQRYTVLHFVTEKVENKSYGYLRLLKLLADKKLTAKYLYTNDSIIFTDKVSVKTIWPDKTWFNRQNFSRDQGQDLDLNGFSLIDLIGYGDFKVLLTGDAGSLTEDRVAATLGKVDVLKVPHHGSKTGMSDYFLDKIQPKLALISVGKENKYGHPAQSALDLLLQRGIKMLRTDRDGEIEVISDGKSYWLSN